MCIICDYKDTDECSTIQELDDFCEDISYIPSDFINLEKITLEGTYDNIITLSYKLVKLTHMNIISGARLSYIPDTFINLKILNCIGAELKYIPSTLVNLISLDCSCNQIIEIPDTLVNLTYLDCSNNQIVEIPDTLINLTFLDCSNNQIVEIPDTLINLTFLDCSDNQISEIPDTLVNLTYLNCSYNDIYNLPYTLIKLVTLKIKNNPCESLPAVYINLEFLNISNSNIFEIPKTYINLKKLVMLFEGDYYDDNEDMFYILFISIKKLINLELLIGFEFKEYDMVRYAFSNDEIINYINTGIIIYGLYFTGTVKIHHYKKYTQKNLLTYANMITDQYLNPDSPYAKYICEHLLEPRDNEIGYITSNNELKIFKIKK